VRCERVLVVGTTPDYVDIICRRFPGRAVFLTDGQLRAAAAEPCPDPVTELQYDLTRTAEARLALQEHLRQCGIHLGGIACFDCESMALAAAIARDVSLPFPSPASILACRSKVRTKRLWQQAGVPCPDAMLVDQLPDALSFLERIDGPAVMKPLTGSGSELTFLCRGPAECTAAFRTLDSRLARHPDVRMYTAGDGDGPDPRRTFAIEQFVEGAEFSCDFILDGDRVETIRVARKIPAVGPCFGTTLAYLVPARLPPELDGVEFGRQLQRGARALGLHKALCMLDFIIRGDTAFFLELTPRPGGDCLPPLLLQSAGFDILGCALDFAEQRRIAVPAQSEWRRMVGLRLFASRSGLVRGLDTVALRADERVRECELVRGPGHTVVMPPADYSSRLLGHAIFEPRAADDVEDACAEIASKLNIDFEDPPCTDKRAL